MSSISLIPGKSDAFQARRKQNTADDAVKAVHGQLNRGAASPFPKGKGGKDDKKVDPKKGVRQAL